MIFLMRFKQWPRALIQLDHPLLDEGGKFETAADFADDFLFFQFVVHVSSPCSF